MKIKNILILLFSAFAVSVTAQDASDLPDDFLSSAFHQGRRILVREKMPENSVAVFFANPVRNRANDVDYVYHQDPIFITSPGIRNRMRY